MLDKKGWDKTRLHDTMLSLNHARKHSVAQTRNEESADTRAANSF